MLEIEDNKCRNTHILLIGMWILIVLMVKTIPIVVAKYAIQSDFSDQARVAKFDIEVIPPNEWLTDETNQIVFTLPGNVTEVGVPFIVINNSEVKVLCNINAYHENLGIQRLGEWEIDIGEEVVCKIEIPESAIGESLFELIVLVEQVD